MKKIYEKAPFFLSLLSSLILYVGGYVGGLYPLFTFANEFESEKYLKSVKEHLEERLTPSEKKELKIGFDDQHVTLLGSKFFTLSSEVELATFAKSYLKGLKVNRERALGSIKPPSLLSSAPFPLLLYKRVSSWSCPIDLKKLDQNLDRQFKTGGFKRSHIPQKEHLPLSKIKSSIKQEKDLSLPAPSPADLADLMRSTSPSHLTLFQTKPILTPLSSMNSPHLSVLFPSKKLTCPVGKEQRLNRLCKIIFYHSQKTHTPKGEPTLRRIEQAKDLDLLTPSPAHLADLMGSTSSSHVAFLQTEPIAADLSRMNSPHLSVSFPSKRLTYPIGEAQRLTLSKSKEKLFKYLKWIPSPFKKLPFYHPPLRKPLITGEVEGLIVKKFSPHFLQKGAKLNRFSISVLHFDSIFPAAPNVTLQKKQKITPDRKICFNLFYLPKLEKPLSTFFQKRSFPAFQERERNGIVPPFYPNLERGGTCLPQEKRGGNGCALLEHGEKPYQSFSLSMPHMLLKKGEKWLKDRFFAPKRAVETLSEIKGLALSTPSPSRLQTSAPTLMPPSTEPEPFGIDLEGVIKGGRGIVLSHFSDLGLKPRFKEDLSEGSVQLGLSHPELKIALSEKEMHEINQNHRVTEGYLRDTFSERDIKVLSFDDEFGTTLTYFQKADRKGYDFALTLKLGKKFHAPSFAQNFIFVLDCSASIKKHRYNTFKEAIIKAVPYMTSGDLFNVILADSKIRSMSKKPIAWNQDALDQVRSYLDRSEYRGYFANRNTFQLITEIENYFDSEKENVVVLLTDGHSLKQIEKEKNAFKALAKKSKGLFSLFTASASQGNNITMLDLISTFNNGEFMYSPTHAAFPRKLAIFVKHIKHLLAKDIYIQALAKDGTEIRFYPNREAYPLLYSDTPYTVYGSINRLNDFDLILQGRFNNQWVNVQQPISFASAKEVNRVTFERNFALQKAYSYYGDYLKESDPSLLKKAEEVLKHHHLYSQVK